MTDQQDVVWMILDHRYDPDALGFVPSFLDPNDPQTAKEQIDAGYQHGGGWHSMPGFTIDEDGMLSYPGDPPMKPIAMAGLRDEVVIMYPYSWVVIMQKDKSFEIARID